MAKKYCDSNLASADVEGTLVNNQFTISKVWSGTAGVNSIIVSKDGSYTTALPNIASFNSGAGYEGSYNLSVYLSSTPAVGRYKLYGGGMIAKPAVGFAQDGDGLGKGRGTPASVAIDLTGYSVAAGTNSAITFSIGGASMSASTSATGTTFNTTGGLSGATLASALVTAINSATNTVVVTGTGNPMLNWRASQLRSLVYAWVDAGTPAILRIQTRCASAAYNNTTFFQCVSSGFTKSGGTQITAQFSGGVSGAWQHLIAYGTSLIIEGGTQSRYGILGDTLLAGTLDPGDKVYLRATDDEDQDTYALTGGWGNGAATSLRAMGSFSQPVEFIVDDGTEWPTSNPTPTFRWKMLASASGYQYILFGNIVALGAATSFFRIIGKRFSTTGKSNFSYEPVTLAGVPVFMCWTRIQVGMYMYFENLDFYAGNNATYYGAFSLIVNMISTLSAICTFKGVSFQAPQSLTFIESSYNSNSHGMLRLIDCDFDNTGNPSPHAGVLGMANSGTTSQIYEFDNVRFKNFVPGSRWAVNAADYRSMFQIKCRNVEYGGITILGPNFGVYNASAATSPTRLMSSFSQYGNREFFIDTMQGFCDWTAGRGYPTLNAKLFDKITPWSIRATTTVVAGQINEYQPFVLPRIGKVNTLNDGVRTFTLNFLVNDTLSWNTSNIGFEIQYEATDGTKVHQSVYDRVGTALTPAPEAAWTGISGGKVKFEGVDHTPYKVTFTSLANKPVKKGTEIAIYIRLYATVSNTNQGVFICPEILVT